VVKLQADNVPIAEAVAPCSQRAYSLGSYAMGQTDGCITLFQNVPWGAGHNNPSIGIVLVELGWFDASEFSAATLYAVVLRVCK